MSWSKSFVLSIFYVLFTFFVFIISSNFYYLISLNLMSLRIKEYKWKWKQKPSFIKVVKLNKTFKILELFPRTKTDGRKIIFLHLSPWNFLLVIKNNKNKFLTPGYPSFKIDQGSTVFGAKYCKYGVNQIKCFWKEHEKTLINPWKLIW